MLNSHERQAFEKILSTHWHRVHIIANGPFEILLIHVINARVEVEVARAREQIRAELASGEDQP